MKRPNKRYVVRLEPAEREQLEQLVSVGKGAAARLTRARVLLQADQSESGPGWVDAQISEGLAQANVVYPARAERRFCLRDGERAGGLSASLRSEATDGLYGRDQQAVG